MQRTDLRTTRSLKFGSFQLFFAGDLVRTKTAARCAVTIKAATLTGGNPGLSTELRAYVGDFNLIL
jgi:hypothetical protein